MSEHAVKASTCAVQQRTACHTCVLHVNSSSCSSLPQHQAPRSVSICQSAQQSKLAVLYQPLRASLWLSFATPPLNAQCSAQLAPTDLCALPSALHGGDTFLWVGADGVHLVPWTALGRSGVRRVLYETDEWAFTRAPAGAASRDTMNGLAVDEVWHYSHANDARWSTGVMHRYVPPGSINEKSARAPAASTLPPVQPPLVYLGEVQGVASRLVCWNALARHLPPHRLQLVAGTYSAAEHVERKLQMSSGVGLNIHKACSKSYAATLPVEAFRLATYLSSGIHLILSQRSHLADEAEYAGIVSFVGPRDGGGNDTQSAALLSAAVVEEYARISAMTVTERGKLHASRAAAFRAAFAPPRILERAGVTELLCGRPPTSPGTASQGLNLAR